MDDSQFLDQVADTLAALPAVEAVTLGGSRSQGIARPDSDWDMAIYYRGAFDPQSLRDVGWDGEVSEIGDWGGGVFNGGAWLHIDGRPVDVHYRDLAVVERELERSRRGDFHIEPLMFHLAGIPSYLVVAELGINQVLRGELPRPTYPDELRRLAPEVWMGRARMNLVYAEHNDAIHGRVTQTAGLLAVASFEFAHAVMAARGAWATNEKRLLADAGLDQLDEVIAGLSADPETLTAAVIAVRDHGESAVRRARER